jgi:hypothetical protein
MNRASFIGVVGMMVWTQGAVAQTQSTAAADTDEIMVSCLMDRHSPSQSINLSSLPNDTKCSVTLSGQAYSCLAPVPTTPGQEQRCTFTVPRGAISSKLAARLSPLFDRATAVTSVSPHPAPNYQYDAVSALPRIYPMMNLVCGYPFWVPCTLDNALFINVIHRFTY